MIKYFLIYLEPSSGSHKKVSFIYCRTTVCCKVPRPMSVPCCYMSTLCRLFYFFFMSCASPTWLRSIFPLSHIKARGCVNKGWQKRYFHKNYDAIQYESCFFYFTSRTTMELDLHKRNVDLVVKRCFEGLGISNVLKLSENNSDSIFKFRTRRYPVIS